MVWYIFLVAVVNLAVGFAVAVCAGRRYRELCVRAVEAAMPANAFPQPTPQSPIPTSPAAIVEEAPALEAQAAVPEVEADASAAQPEDGAHKPARSDPIHALAPAEKPDESGHDDQAPSDGVSTPEREMSSSEACLEHFKGEVGQYHQELTRLDNAFRACRDNPDAGRIRSIADSLQEANEEYLASRGHAHQTFEELYAEEEDFQGIADEFRAILGRQDAEIEDTSRAIEELDYEGDLAEGCSQVVQQTTRLLEANHCVRDALEEASVAAFRHDGRLESIDPAKQNDPLTDLSSRAGLEACLAQWWAKDPHRARRLHAAMIDVDQFGRLNERYGPETCDRILRAIGQLLTAESRNHLLVARFSGQRFILLFPDVDLRFASNVVERVRQTIEMARLEYQTEDIRVTVSCAVTEVTSEDTTESLYARAEATLQEAKRYGRNRTFVHEGKYPTPVVPPNFTLSEKSITI